MYDGCLGVPGVQCPGEMSREVDVNGVRKRELSLEGHDLS